MVSGAIDAIPVTTSGGKKHPFSPPEGFAGTKQEYAELIRARYDAFGQSQQIQLIADVVMKKDDPERLCEGPYKDVALVICQRIASI